jgi:uncharacterized protein YdhG (YjbR/CyaY superfamily)
MGGYPPEKPQKNIRLTVESTCTLFSSNPNSEREFLMSSEGKFTTVEEYMSSLPPEVKIIMESMRKTIRETAPDAKEVMGYGVPAFKSGDRIVYYAAFKNHIGFYPGPEIIGDVFRDELAGYDTSKGTIKFPMDKPMPLDLVKRIVKYKFEC